MKKLKPMTWILIAIAVYVLFFMDMGTEVVMTDERQTGLSSGAKEKCSGKKCKAVRRRGVLGIGRQVAKDWCKASGNPSMPCTCLGNRCA